LNGSVVTLMTELNSFVDLAVLHIFVTSMTELNGSVVTSMTELNVVPSMLSKSYISFVSLQTDIYLSK